MKVINQVITRGLIVFLLSAFMFSCASIPELKVHYQLPPRSDELKGKRVVLVIKDARMTKEILGQGAQKEFKNFSGNFSFSLARYNEPGFKIGIFQVPAMIREAFKRRLENLCLKVLFERSPAEPRLLIVLQEFLLDFQGRKWVAKMSYEARLVKDGN